MPAACPSPRRDGAPADRPRAPAERKPRTARSARQRAVQAKPEVVVAVAVPRASLLLGGRYPAAGAALWPQPAAPPPCTARSPIGVGAGGSRARLA
eukprot:scaffold7319_cov72-Phaeocystis_antarctica.AAC.2